ncbi:MAG: ABC transporter permease [Alcaligenaceae bacterium]|nr:ABC transporter permease [Alcaligenaceae bacterium]
MIYVLLVPAVLFFSVFFILPMIKLFFVGGSGELGWSAYAEALTNPNYVDAMIATFGVAAATTIATLIISGISGFFLQRHRFPGRRALVSMLTLPLAFPGVVVGFMIIMLAGRQGLIGQMSQALGAGKIVFAYSLVGLFLGYVYFSIPRTILTIMAATEKLDTRLEEAARSLGASNLHVMLHVILPALKPAFIASGAICFATAVSAFGTAFTLAARINVMPMVIYTEFTMSANIAMAAALSFVLGLVTWFVLALARSAGGASVAAAG